MNYNRYPHTKDSNLVCVIANDLEKPKLTKEDLEDQNKIPACWSFLKCRFSEYIDRFMQDLPSSPSYTFDYKHSLIIPFETKYVLSYVKLIYPEFKKYLRKLKMMDVLNIIIICDFLNDNDLKYYLLNHLKQEFITVHNFEDVKDLLSAFNGHEIIFKDIFNYFKSPLFESKRYFYRQKK